MKPETKIFSIIFAYCSLLWLSNISISRYYTRDIGVVTSSSNIRSLGIVLGIILSIIFIKKIWAVTRIILDAGKRIPMTERLWGHWRYLWLLVPLALRTNYSTTGVAEDGVSIQTIFEYGGDGSAAIILISAATIMLFQLLIRLETFNPKTEKTPNRLKPIW